MMKRIVTLLCLRVAAPVAAQTQPNPGVAGSAGNMQFGGVSRIIDNGAFGGWNADDTPTMRQQRIAWATAIRDQARQFQAEDGGVLSDHHARYLRRRINRLLLR
jgi:hypothetical protein